MHQYVGNPSANATFSPGVEVHSLARWLSISGQVPRDANGNVPDGIEAQAELVWTNLAAVLSAGGMTVKDLVEVTIYLINRDDGPIFDRVRRKWLEGHKPASTKVIVVGLADARMLCEVQATAAI